MTTEKKRESLDHSITPDFLQRRLEEGWRPVAIEWEREDSEAVELGRTEVPFGLRISADPTHLEQHPEEMVALRVVLAQIVLDRPLSEVAAELNRRELRQRGGDPWNQSTVFELLPRVIEMAPGIYSSESWKREKPKP